MRRIAGAVNFLPSLGMPEFVVLCMSFLLKVLIFILAYVVFLADSEFTTDLFVNSISQSQFLFCIVVVSVMTYLLYTGLVTPRIKTGHVRRLDPSINLFFIVAIIIGYTVAYFALAQKTLSLSSSLALLAIAANNGAVALLSLAIFALGTPQGIAQDEYIPLIFCGLLNLYVFLPWLTTKGKCFLLAIYTTTAILIALLATYYVAYRYSAFKLVERIFEQAAPLSWEGKAWLWFQPNGVIEGMPFERTLAVMDGTWDAQFKATYLIVNAPIFGSLFLMIFAYLLGTFAARTLINCRQKHSNVLKNFLKLKLLLILIETLGEKVSDTEKLMTYIALIILIETFELLSARSRSKNPSTVRPSI